MRRDLANDGTCSIPGTIRKGSPEIFPQRDEVEDRSDTDHYKKPDAETNWEQLSLNNANPRRTSYDLRHTPQPNYNDGYRY